MEYAKWYITNTIDHTKIAFSDEKRFTCDGPDSVMTYQELTKWNNSKNNQIKRIKRQMGGGSIMILGMITYDGHLEVKIIKGKYKCEDYLKHLKQFITFLDLKFGKGNYYFQQDNCAVHTAKVVSKWLSDNEINLIPHPARSSDMNLIENVWKLMQDHIYANKQYRTVSELEVAILEAVDWFNMEKKNLQSHCR